MENELVQFMQSETQSMQKAQIDLVDPEDAGAAALARVTDAIPCIEWSGVVRPYRIEIERMTSGAGSHTAAGFEPAMRSLMCSASALASLRVFVFAISVR